MGAAKKLAPPPASTVKPALEVEIDIRRDMDDPRHCTWTHLKRIAEKRGWTLSEALERAMHEGIRGRQREYFRVESDCGTLRVTGTGRAIAAFDRTGRRELDLIGKALWGIHYPEGITPEEAIELGTDHYSAEDILISALADGMDALIWQVLGIQMNDADADLRLVRP
jgi:hypothetical protein